MKINLQKRVCFSLGDLLRQAREEQNLSLDEASALTGIGRRKLVLMEAGSATRLSNLRLYNIVYMFKRLGKIVEISYKDMPHAK